MDPAEPQSRNDQDAQDAQGAPGSGKANGGDEPASHPARELSLLLLRMLETRMDAAGIVVQAETSRIMFRIQLKLLAAAAVFIAMWGGIVLLAIALPEHLRVPVLAGVIAAFVIGAVVALVVANRKTAGGEVGSLGWFLEGLRQDLEVFARSLSQAQAQPQPQPKPNPTPPDQPRSPPSDLAA
jgi:uncharacterized membrane protein YqjE